MFDQLGEINTTRNNIVHWGVVHDWASGIADSPGVIVTNKHLLQPGRTEQRYLVSMKDLSNMTLDLTKIGIHCNVEILREHIGRDIYRRALREVLGASWSYKPPQRSAPPQRSPGKSPKRRRPPPASAE